MRYPVVPARAIRRTGIGEGRVAMVLGRRARMGLIAVALATQFATGSGCKWIPVRREAKARADDPIARAEEEAGLPVLPPLRSVNDDEAFRAVAPTPLLDAAAERDVALQRALALAMRPEPAAPIAPPPPLKVEVEPPREVPEPDDGIRDAPPESAKSDPHVEPAAFRPPAVAKAAEPAMAPAPEETPREAAPAAPSDEETLWDYVFTALAVGSHAQVPAPAPPAPPEFRIADLRICRRVLGFGRTEPLATSAVASSQPILLYCEIEGIRDEECPGGVRSRLASVVSIEPAEGGAALWREDLGVAEDLCERRRRDFFVNYRLTIPAGLAPGEYRIRLDQTDLLADRHATQTVPLTVRAR